MEAAHCEAFRNEHGNLACVVWTKSRRHLGDIHAIFDLYILHGVAERFQQLFILAWSGSLLYEQRTTITTFSPRVTIGI